MALALALALALAPGLAPAPALALVLPPAPLSCSEPEVGESQALKQRIFLVATVERHGGWEEEKDEEKEEEDTGSIYSFSAPAFPIWSQAFLSPFKPPLCCSSTRSPWNTEAYEERLSIHFSHLS